MLFVQGCGAAGYGIDVSINGHKNPDRPDLFLSPLSQASAFSFQSSLIDTFHFFRRLYFRIFFSQYSIDGQLLINDRAVGCHLWYQCL